MRFLVVDDSSVDRKLIVSMLEELGHQVDACRDTSGVLEKIASGNYAALFLDIVMPEQDGFQFLRELRLNPATAKQYVIFCSSKKTPVEINYGIRRAGANDYLTKSVTKESLERALEKV
jgi:two-component system chemotaxis response regulator CheY